MKRSRLAIVAALAAAVVAGSEAADAAGLTPLPFSARHSVRVAQLPRHHADPFDRALVAQALSESLTLITHDTALAGYGSTVRIV